MYIIFILYFFSEVADAQSPPPESVLPPSLHESTGDVLMKMNDVRSGLNANNTPMYPESFNYNNHRNLNMARIVYYPNPDLTNLNFTGDQLNYLASLSNGKAVILTPQHVQANMVNGFPLKQEYDPFQPGDLVRYFQSRSDPNDIYYKSVTRNTQDITMAVR